jgi:hypothetical protein
MVRCKFHRELGPATNALGEIFVLACPMLSYLLQNGPLRAIVAHHEHRLEAQNVPKSKKYDTLQHPSRTAYS